MSNVVCFFPSLTHTPRSGHTLTPGEHTALQTQHPKKLSALPQNPPPITPNGTISHPSCKPKDWVHFPVPPPPPRPTYTNPLGLVISTSSHAVQFVLSTPTASTQVQATIISSRCSRRGHFQNTYGNSFSCLKSSNGFLVPLEPGLSF